MSSIPEVKTEMDQLREQKEKLFARQKEISQAIAAKIAGIKEHKQKRDELTKQVKTGKDQRNTLNDQIKQQISVLKTQHPQTSPSTHVAGQSAQSAGQTSTVTTPVDATSDQNQEPTPAEPQIFGRRPFRPKNVETNPMMIRKEIKRMERTIETAGITFEQEQKLMKIIKEKNKQLAKIESERKEHVVSRKMSSELTKLKSDSDVIHEQIQSAAKQSQIEHEALLQLAKDVDELRKEEQVIRTEINELKSKLKVTGIEFDTGKKEQKSVPHYARRSRDEDHKIRDVESQKKIARQLEEQLEEVEQKIQKKKKLTTEDLLVFQSSTKGKEL